MLSKLFNACTIIGKHNKSQTCSGMLMYSTTQQDNAFIPNTQTPIPETDENQSRFRRWTGKERYKLALLAVGGFGLISFGSLCKVYGPPHVDNFGEIIEDKYTSMNPIIGYPLRTFQAMKDFNQSIVDPISEKLLPDAHPLYHPMTLVIETNHVLLHPEWNYKSGWKFKKRPGLELFLDAVSPFFEVVVFSNEVAMNLHPILQQLDPQFQKMHYRLYRESTRYRYGVHIKDLDNLNRDLNKVIRIDWDRKACALQPRNTLLLKKWTGDESDRDLIDLAAFLRMIVSNNLTDVREGLEYYAQFDDPLSEFRQRCESLKEHIKKVQDESNTKKKKSTTFNNIMSNLRKV